MNNQSFVIKGNVIYSRDKREIEIKENSYLICEDGKCAGVFTTLPEKYEGLYLFILIFCAVGKENDK